MSLRRLTRRAVAGAGLALVGAASVGAALAGCGEPEPAPASKPAASAPAAAPVATPPIEPAPVPPSTAGPPARTPAESPVGPPTGTATAPDAAPALASGPEALEAARRRGRPLLACFVPADAAARADRARALDVLLAPDLVAARVPLVFAHVVALAAAELDAIAPGASADAPFAVVVETDGGGAATRSIPWPAALAGPSGFVSFDVARRGSAREEPGPDRALWDLARALDDALLGGPATAARRAAQRAAAGDPVGALVEPGAAQARRRAADEAVEAWRRAPIPGTRWVPIDAVPLPHSPGAYPWCGTGRRAEFDGLVEPPEDDLHLDGSPLSGFIRVRLDGPLRARRVPAPTPQPGPAPELRDPDRGPPGLASPTGRLRLEFLAPAQ